MQARQKSLAVVLGVIRSCHMSLHRGWHGNDNFRISTLLLCTEVGVQEGEILGQGDSSLHESVIVTLVRDD